MALQNLAVMDAFHRLARSASASLLAWYVLLSQLLMAPIVAAEGGGFSPWKCDDLTPNLCNLDVTKGRIPIGDDGMLVTYWKYSAPTSAIDLDENALLPPPPSPVVMIHGGPGMTHNYMLPLKQLACRPDEYGRTRDVYFYDQGGCGESMLPVSSSESHKTTNASNSNTAKLVEDYPYLLDPQYYATIELPKILEELGLDTNGYHIVGNSWGTILAQYFVLNTDAKGLKSLTLSGPLSDGDLYVDSQWSEAGYNNLGQLPPYVKHRIAVLEAEGAYESEEYQLIDDVLTGKFTVRTQPAPDCWWACFDGINREVYVGLQGPSEFTFGGVLGGFSTTERLHTITVPVALTSGAYDTMRPPVVDVMYREIPKAEWTILEHSGHVTMIDDAGWTNDVVNDFLTRVEAASNSPEGPASFEPLPDKCGPEGCVPKGVPLTDGGGAATVEGDFSMGVVLWVGIVSFCMGVLASECLGLASGGRRSAGYQSL